MQFFCIFPHYICIFCIFHQPLAFSCKFSKFQIIHRFITSISFSTPTKFQSHFSPLFFPLFFLFFPNFPHFFPFFQLNRSKFYDNTVKNAENPQKITENRLFRSKNLKKRPWPSLSFLGHMAETSATVYFFAKKSGCRSFFVEKIDFSLGIPNFSRFFTEQPSIYCMILYINQLLLIFNVFFVQKVVFHRFYRVFCEFFVGFIAFML